MSIYALTLVIIAALLHATWNFAAKKSGGSTVFAFCTGLVTVTVWAPVVFILIQNFPERSHTLWNLNQWLIVALGGAIHAAYYVVLLKGYRAAPLSIVYPIARGTGPLISSFSAIWIFHENFTYSTLLGICFIVGGIFTLTWSKDIKLNSTLIKGALWGVATGITISLYTLVDAYGVKTLKVDPIMLDFWTGAFRVLVLLPFVISRTSEIKSTLSYSMRPLLIISILGSAAYILVLTAIKIAPVSHVAPAREISMLFGAFLGGKVLNEGQVLKRIFAAALIATGVILLALS